MMANNKNSAVAEMGDRVRAEWAEKWGAAVLLSVGRSWVSIKHNVASAKAYLRNKWHLDPFNRLATIHQRHRQTDRHADRTMVR